jgi:gamma-butyrobetaine dioxygenase
MTSSEAQGFRDTPHAAAAVALRRWDDAAKDPTLKVAGVEEYTPYIVESLAIATAASRGAR